MILFKMLHLFFTGAMRIRGGEVKLISVRFADNIIQTFEGFPSLRHNIFISNGANLTTTESILDTGTSNFIYVSSDSSVSNVNLKAPMFVPYLKSVSPSKKPSTPNIEFTFTGSYFYPCNLQVNIYKTTPTNLLQV
jgi:hypothetical protein